MKFVEKRIVKQLIDNGTIKEEFRRDFQYYNREKLKMIENNGLQHVKLEDVNNMLNEADESDDDWSAIIDMVDEIARYEAMYARRKM
jgi:hypothetical protein